MTTTTAVEKSEPTVKDAKALTTAPRTSLLATMAAKFEVDPKVFESTIMQTVIKGKATREQVVAFLIVANQYDLNPFTKEIHAFVQGGGIQPIVGIDGWVRLVNRQVDFDGCEIEDIEDDKGNLTAVKTKMHHKRRRHPVVITEYMAECKGTSEPWKKWPRRMLRHKSFIQAARYAFGFAGIVDPDEAERIRESGGLQDAEIVTLDMAAATDASHSGSFEDAPKPEDFNKPANSGAADESKDDKPKDDKPKDDKPRDAWTEEQARQGVLATE